MRFRLEWTENAHNASVETPDVHGTQPWTEVSIPWTATGDASRQVRVCISRKPSDDFGSRIHGSAWIDDVALTPAPNAHASHADSDRHSSCGLRPRLRLRRPDAIVEPSAAHPPSTTTQPKSTIQSQPSTKPAPAPPPATTPPKNPTPKSPPCPRVRPHEIPPLLHLPALIVFGVLAHGGVEDWARAIIETGAGLLFFLWAFLFYFDKSDDQKRVYISPLLPPLILLAAIALGQLLLRATASTYDTRMELNLLVAYILILFLATQAFRYSDDWRGYIWFVMIFGFLVVHVRHPPAAHLQRQALLVPRDALWRHPVRPVRQSQPLRRLRRTRHPRFARAARSRQGSPRTLVRRRDLRAAADRCALPLALHAEASSASASNSASSS